MSEQQEIDQKRFELNLSILFSMNYEKMIYKFCYRIDKLSSFFILFGAMAVIDKNIPAFALGSFLAVFSVFQIVYSPAAKYLAAKNQYSEYFKLYQIMDTLGYDELFHRYSELQHNDNDGIGMLYHPARLSALAMLGYDNRDDGVNERDMTISEKAASLFIGEYPEYNFNK